MSGINLADWIKENPKAVFVVDNDCWWAFKDEETRKHEEEEGEGRPDIDHSDVIPVGDGGYGSGNCYGGDILQALARVVGVKIESV